MAITIHIYPLLVMAGLVVGTAAILLCWLAFKFKHRISTTLKYCAIATKEVARKLFSDSCEKTSTTAVTVFNPRIEYAKHLLAFLDDPQPLEVIGRGGCGTVYKAELLDGSIALAVKEILPPSNGSAQVQHLPLVETKFLNHQMRQIRNEVGTVGHLRHRNILPLLAHASRPDRHYLVYEFMKNGSLHEALVAASHGSRELEWPVRYNVAVGVAMGLEYLHMEHRPQVVHRDLKPANILLDNDLNARIADFGLAKLVPDAVISGQVMSTGVAGTLGYIAPEYYQLRRFTDKCDIYSFGVILAVLVIGKFPSDPFFYMTEETCLVQWLRDVMKSENPNVAIDSRLLGNGFEREMLLVLKIACFCTNDDPRERPNSRDVRCMLFQVKNK